MCNRCSSPLIGGEGGNWTPGNQRTSLRRCKKCHNELTRKWKRDNPHAAKKWNHTQRNKNAANRLYVITHPREPEHVKVGLTRFNPDKRLNAYNTGCPRRAYRYAALVEVSDVVKAERLLHETLEEFREGTTEWFRVPVEVAVRLVQSLALKE